MVSIVLCSKKEAHRDLTPAAAAMTQLDATGLLSPADYVPCEASTFFRDSHAGHLLTGQSRCGTSIPDMSTCRDPNHLTEPVCCWTAISCSSVRRSEERTSE